MIYQVKGVSRYVWGVCGCVQVCTGGCAWVDAGLCGCGCMGTGGCVRVWVGADVRGWVHVCGMNFQNFFWRIESLHQRTLIRILYEFL